MKKLFAASLSILLLGQIFAYATPIAYAAATENSIRDYLCAPSEGAASVGNQDLANCVNKLYRFGIAFGFTVAVLAVVIAGYMYMGGSQEGKKTAKSILGSTLVGIGILLFSYILLKQINPALVQFRSVQPSTVTDLACQGKTLEDCIVSGVPGFGTAGGTTSTIGGGTPSTVSGMTDAEARAKLRAAGVQIALNNDTLNGIKPFVVDEVIALKQSCGCNVVVTGAVGNHTAGVCDHAHGYKIDVDDNATLDAYIMSHYSYAGIRGDGAKLYKNPSSPAVYARESTHWDIQRCN